MVATPLLRQPTRRMSARPRSPLARNPLCMAAGRQLRLVGVQTLEDCYVFMLWPHNTGSRGDGKQGSIIG
eukprot:270638-Prorocentrum_lima.AAC.1